MAKKINKKVNPKKKSKGGLGQKVAIGITNGLIRTALDVLVYVVLIFAVIFACKFGYTFCFEVFGSAPVTSDYNAYSMTITIRDGESTKEVAETLDKYELIPSKYSFMVKAKLDKANIVPGTFLISSNMDYDQILALIGDFSAAEEHDQSEYKEDEDNTEEDGELIQEEGKEN